MSLLFILSIRMLAPTVGPLCSLPSLTPSIVLFRRLIDERENKKGKRKDAERWISESKHTQDVYFIILWNCNFRNLTFHERSWYVSNEYYIVILYSSRFLSLSLSLVHSRNRYLCITMTMMIRIVWNLSQT